jgi:hypothetical protein
MKQEKNHKHSWAIPEGREDNDILICEHCGVDYDEWVEKMLAKGYTYEQLTRFENQM